MNPTPSTINPNKQVYDIGGTKVRATSQDEANNLAQEITTEKNSALTVPTPRNRPVKDTSSTSSFTESPVPQPKSVESITSDMLNMAQGELSYLDNYYKQQLDEQKNINAKNDRSTQAISTLTGLAGSTEADVKQQETTDIGKKTNRSILNEAKAAAQAVYGRVSKAATEEARAQRLEARQTEQERIANRAARQQQAVNEIQNISASGITLDGLKKTDKNTYDYLVRQFGSEEALKGAYVLNTPQDQILDKRIENGKYIIARQNPLTGKTSIESTDLGLPTGYSKTIDAGDKILAIPDNWDGDTSKLITINKGLIPKEQSLEENETPVVLTPEQQKDPFVQKIVSSKGGKPISDTFAQKIDKGLVVLGQIGVLQENIKDIKTGPIVGAFKGKNPWDTNAQTIKAQLNAIVPNLARGVYGEVGVLTDNDIKNYAKTLPTLTSPEDIRNAVLGITVDMIGKSIKNTLEVNIANQKDVSGFLDIYTDLNKTKDSILSQIPGYESQFNDPYAQFRSQLQPGEMMVLRDGNVVAITQNELLSTDQQL